MTTALPPCPRRYIACSTTPKLEQTGAAQRTVVGASTPLDWDCLLDVRDTLVVSHARAAVSKLCAQIARRIDIVRCSYGELSNVPTKMESSITSSLRYNWVWEPIAICQVESLIL